MPIHAVLFDFDGVLADTENVHVAAWERTFFAMGWEVPSEVCARAAEEDDRLFLKSVFADRGVRDGDLKGWIARKQATTLEMLSANPRVYRGVRELVDALVGRAKLAVVTGTWRANVQVVLNASGLTSSFDAIVAKEDAKRPKPDPAVYLAALAALGVSAKEAVALEDSRTGVESARSAGVRVVAVGHRHDPGAWSEGLAYVDRIADHERVLEAIGL